jgi:hypothetical protein
VTALTRAGITTTAQLAALTRAELIAVDGLGPGSVAAIRRVVPEPPGRLPATEPQPDTRRLSSPDDEESPDAPRIPSFESLRSTRRRTTVDLIVPATPPPPPPPPPPDVTPTGPRPPDYADLWRLGMRVGQTLATLPARLALVAVQRPTRSLRRLLGG